MSERRHWVIKVSVMILNLTLAHLNVMLIDVKKYGANFTNPRQFNKVKLSKLS